LPLYLSSISISDEFLGVSLKVKSVTVKVSDVEVKPDKSRAPDFISLLKVWFKI